MINPIRLVRDHPLLTFALLACLFGWSSYITAAFGLSADPGNNPLGPVFAALIVVACQSRAALAEWWRRLRSWKASPGWYALAVLAPIVVHVSIVLINHAFGAPLPTMAQLGHWPEIPINFLVLLVIIGIGEESGWTAFAATLLLRRHGLLGAWALMSGLRILWHVPVMITGESGWVMGFVGNAAFQLILLEMLRAGGPWSLAAVWHATLNTFGGSFFFTMVAGADFDRLELLLAGAYTVLAIVAVFLGRRYARTREPDPAVEPAEIHV
jgi:membrane protease YdiL (CAAX protease family)